MRHASLSALLPCPIARSLEIVGEWWTLLIVRDALVGARRFDDFKATGIADNILTTRLKKLVAAGILKRQPYQKHPIRYEYVLTDKGRSLAPVVLALRAWGNRWTKGPDLTAVTHATCGHDIGIGFHCAHCARDVPGTEVRPARIA